MVQASDIEQAIKDCLGIIDVSINDCRLKIYDCGSIDDHGAGAYVFFDESTIYYVGEADDAAHRLLNEHCLAHVGGSEGVVRFLMHYLDEVCTRRNEWIELDAKGREGLVKAILKDRITRLSIYVVMCKGLGDTKQGNRRIKNRLRAGLKDCLLAAVSVFIRVYVG